MRLVGPIVEFWKRVFVSKPGWILAGVNLALGAICFLFLANSNAPPSESSTASKFVWVFYSFNSPGIFLAYALMYTAALYISPSFYVPFRDFGPLAVMTLCTTLQWLIIGRIIERIWQGAGPTIKADGDP